MQESRDIDRECGIGCFRPRFMQCCASIAAFIAAYCPPALLTSALVVYIASQVTTLERYYGFTSSQSGFLMSCNDIGYLLTTLFVSFLARKVHIPRTLSWSTVLYGIAGIICALAYFALPGRKLNVTESPVKFGMKNETLGNPMPSFNKEFSQMCTESNKSVVSCDDDSTQDKIGAPTEYTTSALAIVGIGMILQGFAKSPRQPYIVTYIDDNVPKQKTSCYLGKLVFSSNNSYLTLMS